MHELAVTKSILKLALDHAVKNNGQEILAISLDIGELRNLEEDWIQRYFTQISKGTMAEKARIKVIKVPVLFRCKICEHEFTADLRDDKKLVCPECGGFEYDLVSGRELLVRNIEVR